MMYKNNEQIKKRIRSIMEHENVTYKDLGEKLGTTQQNAHKMVNKNNLKLKDISQVCDALGYKLSIEILKDDEKINTDSQEEFIASVAEKVLSLTKELEALKATVALAMFPWNKC